MSKTLTKEDLPNCKGIMCLVAYVNPQPCSFFDPIEYPVRESDNKSGLIRVYTARNHYFECYETESRDNTTNKKNCYY